MRDKKYLAVLMMAIFLFAVVGQTFASLRPVAVVIKVEDHPWQDDNLHGPKLSATNQITFVIGTFVVKTNIPTSWFAKFTTKKTTVNTNQIPNQGKKGQ